MTHWTDAILILAASTNEPFPYVVVLGVTVVLMMVATGLLFLRQVKKCPPDTIMVIYGKLERRAPAICQTEGRRYVVPMIQDVAYLSRVPIRLDLSITNAVTGDGSACKFRARVELNLGTDKASMQRAAVRLLGASDSAVQTLATQLMRNAIRRELSLQSDEDLRGNRAALTESLNAAVLETLSKIGMEGSLTLDAVRITN